MGRRQCKNTFNTETSGSKSARPEHPNTNEAEENDLKNNFMKMIEALKEDMKNSLKEVEDRQRNERNQ